MIVKSSDQMTHRVFDELRQYNDQFEPKVNYQEKMFYVEENGEFIGGLEGFLAWDFFEINNVVVLNRGKGIGTALIKEAEKFAKENNANKIIASTIAFQAPNFYKKCGFDEFAVVPHMAGEYACHYFIKRLKKV